MPGTWAFWYVHCQLFWIVYKRSRNTLGWGLSKHSWSFGGHGSGSTSYHSIKDQISGFGGRVICCGPFSSSFWRNWFQTLGKCECRVCWWQNLLCNWPRANHAEFKDTHVFKVEGVPQAWRSLWMSITIRWQIFWIWTKHHFSQLCIHNSNQA